MEENKIMRNIDGEIIDFEKDDLLDKLTYESANLIRRLCAYAVDFLLIIVIWYVLVQYVFKFFGPIDQFVKSFAADEQDLSNLLLYNVYRDLIWKLFLNLALAWVGTNFLYFALVPAILGDGRTVGKLLAGIGVVDLNTLEEVSPLRLILREFIGRTMIETLLIIPLIVSVFISFFRKDGRMLHDLIAKTVVIRLDTYRIEDF